MRTPRAQVTWMVLGWLLGCSQVQVDPDGPAAGGGGSGSGGSGAGGEEAPFCLSFGSSFQIENESYCYADAFTVGNILRPSADPSGGLLATTRGTAGKLRVDRITLDDLQGAQVEALAFEVVAPTSIATYALPTGPVARVPNSEWFVIPWTDTSGADVAFVQLAADGEQSAVLPGRVEAIAVTSSQELLFVSEPTEDTDRPAGLYRSQLTLGPGALSDPELILAAEVGPLAVDGAGNLFLVSSGWLRWIAASAVGSNATPSDLVAVPGALGISVWSTPAGGLLLLQHEDRLDVAEYTVSAAGLNLTPPATLVTGTYFGSATLDRDGSIWIPQNDKVHLLTRATR